MLMNRFIIIPILKIFLNFLLTPEIFMSSNRRPNKSYKFGQNTLSISCCLFCNCREVKIYFYSSAVAGSSCTSLASPKSLLGTVSVVVVLAQLKMVEDVIGLQT